MKQFEDHLNSLNLPLHKETAEEIREKKIPSKIMFFLAPFQDCSQERTSQANNGTEEKTDGIIHQLFYKSFFGGI